jgi:hypothetical protein
MGTMDTVEDDNDDKVVDVPTPPELEPPEYPTSNLHLLILGAALFALWAGSVSQIGPCIDETAKHPVFICTTNGNCTTRHPEGIWDLQERGSMGRGVQYDCLGQPSL